MSSSASGAADGRGQPRLVAHAARRLGRFLSSARNRIPKRSGARLDGAGNAAYVGTLPRREYWVHGARSRAAATARRTAMQGLDALVPAFNRSLEALPGAQEAWRQL